MKNDRLILSLLKTGRLTADLDTGQVYLDNNPIGTKDKHDYVTFRYRHKGVRRIIACHRVVWMCFKDRLPPYGYPCDHGDGIKYNNLPYNLEMVTQATNIQRAYRKEN